MKKEAKISVGVSQRRFEPAECDDMYIFAKYIKNMLLFWHILLPISAQRIRARLGDAYRMSRAISMTRTVT